MTTGLPDRHPVPTRARETINIYCDESCHLENDHHSTMVIGAIWCPKEEVQRLTKNIRLIKRAHNVDPYLEIKWTKVSPAKVALYRDLVDLFFNEPDLRFRAIIIDKTSLRHQEYKQTHDEFYYKMYYYMLRHIVSPLREHHVYIDIKDTKGAKKVAKLHEVLANSFHDTDRSVIPRVQQIRSHESELLQLADLLIGAVGSYRRGFSERSGKGRLIVDIVRLTGGKRLDRNSPYGETKFNLFAWQSQSQP